MERAVLHCFGPFSGDRRLNIKKDCLLFRETPILCITSCNTVSASVI